MRSTSPSALAASRARIRQKERANGYLTCSVPGCPRFRHDLGRHCSTHQKRRERFGHALGGRIPSAALKPHLRWWQRFIELNAERPKIREAVAALDRLLRGEVPDGALAISWRIPRPPRGIRGQLRRLHSGGLRGTEVLALVGALNRLAYSERPRDMGVLPDDDRLTVAYGRAVVFARKRKRHAPEVSGSTYLALGGHLRRQLSGLFAWVTLEERRQKERKAASSR